MTVRWSMTSFIGTDRTDVAVGTVSDDSMFLAVRMGAPRSTVYLGSTTDGAGRSVGLGALADSVEPVPGLAGEPVPLRAAVRPDSWWTSHGSAAAAGGRRRWRGSGRARCRGAGGRGAGPAWGRESGGCGAGVSA